MRVKHRCFLMIGIGVAIGLFAHQLDNCAFLNGPCAGHARFLAVLSVFIVFFAGAGPYLKRWTWSIMKCKDNAYQLTKWQKSYDGPFGEVWEWLVGMDRDGNLRP